MNIDGDLVTFESTGRVEYANMGIIGYRGGTVFTGYDGELCDPKKLTHDERKELANYMIDQWTKFGEGTE